MERRPNILLITTDQQRYDTIPPFAPDFLRVPHLSWLERTGVTFTRAYTDCPVCVPARLTIMSGMHAANHGMILNGRSERVLGHTGTLPDRLRGLGYQTLGVGKMHFNPVRARHGFDETIIYADYVREMERLGGPVQPYRNGVDSNNLEPATATVPEAQTETAWAAQQCHDFIAERRDPIRPFFLWCSFNAPHPPLDPPEPYASMYRNEPIPEPSIGPWVDDERCPPGFRRFVQTWSSDRLSAPVLRDARAAYYGLITQIDYAIGRLLQALQKTGELDRTLIAFASDHGEFLGDHRGMNKVFPFECTARIPFIIRPPAAPQYSSRGRMVDHLVCLADLLPTFVAAAGGEAGDVDGCDLTPVLAGGTEPCRDSLEITCSSFESGVPGRERGEPTYFALVEDPYKYVWYPEGGVQQLFNVETDPHDLEDLSSRKDLARVVAAMHARLAARVGARDPRWSDGTALTAIPIGEDTEAERRANRTPTWLRFERTVPPR